MNIRGSAIVAAIFVAVLGLAAVVENWSAVVAFFQLSNEISKSIDDFFTALGTSLMLLTVPIGLYFLPLIVALTRRHRQTMAIGVLDLCLGWTIVGWVGALVWACTADIKPPPLVGAAR